MLREYKGDRQIYLMGYPKKIDEFKTISNFQDLFKLTDSIIFIDEIQKYIKIYDRKANYDLMELISIFAHNNNTLVFTTCLSQFISKSIEGYIDAWFLTRILDLKSLKNGSKAKRIIEQTTHPKCNKWSLTLFKGEYLEYSELNEPEDNDVKRFEDQKIGKDWKVRLENENPEENPDKNVLKIPPNKIIPKKQSKEPKSPVEMKVSSLIDKERLNKDTHKPKTKTAADKELDRLAWGSKK